VVEIGSIQAQKVSPSTARSDYLLDATILGLHRLAATAAHEVTRARSASLKGFGSA
jgi:hypothetical protein